MKGQVALLIALVLRASAFVPLRSARRPASRLADVDESPEAILERVKRMREEIAALEGRSVDEIEQEAREKKEQRQHAISQSAAKRQESSADADERRRAFQGKFLEVPETADEQVFQAKGAVERAFKDGLTRQIVRFALVPEGERLHFDRQWPGGAQQMYREAAGPMTRGLLRIVRAPTGAVDEVRGTYQPNVTAQDIWDFDGSALVTAEAATGAKDDVQALVQPNTDNKYTEDVRLIDQAMKSRLFLLVNPFWRNLESWGFNLLAPKAKQNAQEAIFVRGFVETYTCLQTTVRGEDCIALKVYPYDWQLFAYAESEYWPYTETAIHLGSTKDEPKSSDFGALLEQREEFKLSKNMRQLQRGLGNKDDR